MTPDKEFVDDHDKESITVDKKTSYDIWESVGTQSLNEPLRYTWESLGKAEKKKEPPFLLESDVDIIEFWKKHNSLANTTCSSNFFVEEILPAGSNLSRSMSEGIQANVTSHQTVDLNTLTYRELFRDIHFLLIGISSKTFYYDEVRLFFLYIRLLHIK